MNKWIDLHALWQIVVLGLVCGAGLPAIFAVGLRALSLPAAGERPVGDDSDRVVGGSVAGMIGAAACFAIVAGAVGWGIYLIVQSS